MRSAGTFSCVVLSQNDGQTIALRSVAWITTLDGPRMLRSPEPVSRLRHSLTPFQSIATAEDARSTRESRRPRGRLQHFLSVSREVQEPPIKARWCGHSSQRGQLGNFPWISIDPALPWTANHRQRKGPSVADDAHREPHQDIKIGCVLIRRPPSTLREEWKRQQEYE